MREKKKKKEGIHFLDQDSFMNQFNKTVKRQGLNPGLRLKSYAGFFEGNVKYF